MRVGDAGEAELRVVREGVAGAVRAGPGDEQVEVAVLGDGHPAHGVRVGQAVSFTVVRPRFRAAVGIHTLEQTAFDAPCEAGGVAQWVRDGHRSAEGVAGVRRSPPAVPVPQRGPTRKDRRRVRAPAPRPPSAVGPTPRRTPFRHPPHRLQSNAILGGVRVGSNFAPWPAHTLRRRQGRERVSRAVAAAVVDPAAARVRGVRWLPCGSGS